MPGDVSVYVRIRPPLAGEPREAAATVLNKETVRLEVARTATVCEHNCDAAFGPHASQAELFDGVARDVVDAVREARSPSRNAGSGSFKISKI